MPILIESGPSVNDAPDSACRNAVPCPLAMPDHPSLWCDPCLSTWVAQNLNLIERGPDGLASDPATGRLIAAYGGFEATQEEWDGLRALRATSGAAMDHDAFLSDDERDLIACSETEWDYHKDENHDDINDQ